MKFIQRIRLLDHYGIFLVSSNGEASLKTAQFLYWAHTIWMPKNHTAIWARIHESKIGLENRPILVSRTRALLPPSSID